MIKFIKILGVFCLLLIPPFLFAQNRQLHFDHLGTANGLSQLNPNAILQDSYGFIWVATNDGLNRYDGYKFKIYRNDVKDTTSIGNNYTQDIKEDNDGNIWIATVGGGLNKFDRKTTRFYRYVHNEKNKNSISSDFLSKVVVDKDGKIWVATKRDGLDLFDPKTGSWTHYLHSDNNAKSIADNELWTVYNDDENNIWVGTLNSGLSLFDRKHNNFINFKHQENNKTSISGNKVSVIFKDSKKQMWIGTQEAGLNLFNKSKGVFTHFVNDPHNINSLVHNSIESIAEDDGHNLWIGTENGGLSVYNYTRQEFSNYAHDDIDNTSLSGNSVNVIVKDRSGNMWTASYEGGINLYKKDKDNFTHYKHSSLANSLSNDFVLCLFEDSRDDFWVGTDGGGLNLLDVKTGKFKVYKHSATDKASISGDNILDIKEDGENNLWIGTWGNGVSVMDSKTRTFRVYKHSAADASSLSGDNIYEIALTSDKKVCLGTYGDGLDLYEPKSNSFIHYKNDAKNSKSISSNLINSLLGDSKGNLWVGTNDAGLNLFNPKTKIFTRYIHNDNSNSLSNNTVLGLCEDRLGNIWICTLGGLDVFDPVTHHFTVFKTKDGLPSDYIQAILESDKGQLWISTNNGISMYDPHTKKFTNYTTEDGLQADEFKPHSAGKSHTGAFYFGGVNGFNSFFPNKVAQAPYDPPVVLTNFQLFNKTVEVKKNANDPSPLGQDISETQSITLSYNQSVMAFEYASLDYLSPNKKSYAYLLDGFDKSWNYVGDKNTAVYTNVPPGDYTLYVKAANSDGVWTQKVVKLEIVIVPPFWETWWFRIVAFSIVVIGIYTLYQNRINKINRQKEELEKQVELRTSELRLQSEELQSVNEELQVQSEELHSQSEYLEKLNEDLILQKENEMEKAVAMGKFEIASEVLHDIGNAMVGFSTYLTRIKRVTDTSNLEAVKNLNLFLAKQQALMSEALGNDRANALIAVTEGIVKTQANNEKEVSSSINELINIVTHIQEILNIQRQFVKGQEGKHERKPVHLNQIIDNCRAMLLASFEKRSVKLDYDVKPGKYVVKGDPTKLMQVILNVLKNSLEALDVESKTNSISISLKADEKTIELKIVDSGCGFDEETSKKFFERGFTTKKSGTGLGLYNCKSIIETHQGTFSITSDGPGLGATTTIKFDL